MEQDTDTSRLPRRESYRCVKLCVSRALKDEGPLCVASDRVDLQSTSSRVAHVEEVLIVCVTFACCDRMLSEGKDVDRGLLKAEVHLLYR